MCRPRTVPATVGFGPTDPRDSASGVGHPMPRSAALLERDAELGAISRALTGAAQGQGRVLVIDGPAGAGKTALLDAARTLAEDAGVRVLRARGAELEREFGFGV